MKTENLQNSSSENTSLAESMSKGVDVALSEGAASELVDNSLLKVVEIEIKKQENELITESQLSENYEEIEKINELKSTLLDSAELATRGAALAAKAGAEMHHAAENLMKNFVIQQKFNKIILGALGGVMLVSIVISTFMAIRMQDRISQLDLMVLAVGKRVVSMDSSIELITNSSDLIKDVSKKQDDINNMQSKLEAKVEESIKLVQVLPDLKNKIPEDQNKDLKILFQGLDVKIQAQTNSNKIISSQLQKLQASVPEMGSFRREVDSITRQLKERQAVEIAVPPPVPAVVVKQREKVVQFPRTALPSGASEKP